MPGPRSFDDVLGRGGGALPRRLRLLPGIFGQTKEERGHRGRAFSLLFEAGTGDWRHGGSGDAIRRARVCGVVPDRCRSGRLGGVSRASAVTASEIIALLGLARHPEGGWYRQTWVEAVGEGRPAGTCIYFLLAEGERSHWHRVDATEIWHFHAGAPLVLRLAERDAGPATRHVLGPDLAAGHRAGGLVAGGGVDRGLDAGQLHRVARLPVRGVRPGAGGVRYSRGVRRLFSLRERVAAFGGPQNPGFDPGIRGRGDPRVKPEDDGLPGMSVFPTRMIFRG